MNNILDFDFFPWEIYNVLSFLNCVFWLNDLIFSLRPLGIRDLVPSYHSKDYMNFKFIAVDILVSDF